MMNETKQYCPYCKRDILPSNTEEVEDGDHDGYIFVHDDVDHPDDFNPDTFKVMH